MLCIHRKGIVPDVIIDTNDKKMNMSIKKIFGEYAAHEIENISSYKNFLYLDDKILERRMDSGGCAEKIQVLENIIFEQSRAKDNFFVFHGGGVAYKDELYLFLGKSTSGKSTLTTFLINNGFKYISDDIIPVNTEKNTASSPGNPIMLRDGGLNVLKSCGIHMECEYCSEIERYLYMPEIDFDSQYTVKKIFFIERSAKNQIHSMNASDILNAILINSKTKYTNIGIALKYIANLNKDNIKKIEYCSFEFILEELMSTDKGNC